MPLYVHKFDQAQFFWNYLLIKYNSPIKTPAILYHQISEKSIIIVMKGFGFPGKATGPGSSTPSYRADTSKQKSELIGVLKRSEQLWNDDKTE